VGYAVGLRLGIYSLPTYVSVFSETDVDRHPIKKAILFGSYAKGNNNPDSDVDLAIFSGYFEGKARVEGITFLLMNAMEYKIDLEPIAFTDKEYEERLGIVAEIIDTGIEIPTQ
jgi:predicted nucleotidyltransferase